MKHWLFLFIFCFISKFLYANEVEIIELHDLDQDVDQGLLDNLDEDTTELISEDQILVIEEENEIENESSADGNQDEISIDNQVSILPNLWENTNKENLVFLFENLEIINSSTLKFELISLLDINSPTPENLDKEDFEKIIISNLIKLGDRETAYKTIQSLYDIADENYNFYYKVFELNYLLSTYKVSEACDMRNSFSDIDLNKDSNFFLKFDIFCLLLKEKYDEANLLNSLLLESTTEKDEYFQNLYNDIIYPDQKNQNSKLIGYEIEQKDIHLFSAMHRVANIPLTQKFLEIDPLNLSMPITLSNASNIKLRLKAANLAFKYGLLNTDSLSALYQLVDFNSDELNDPSNFEKITNGNVELGMAYYHQLSNIQLLPITRLEAILDFWIFSKKNNLENIAYKLSLKGLDTIAPSSEYSEYASDIVNAYIKSQNFDKAQTWLPFIDDTSNDQKYIEKAESSKLLINLYNLNLEDNDAFKDLLKKHLVSFGKIINNNDSVSDIRNELLFILFASLDDIQQNPFVLNKRIDDNRLMPSTYILDNIRNCISSENYSELLLFIISSLEDKKWTDLHPEHLRLILEGIKKYKDGKIFNKIIMEIISENNII